MLFDSGRFARPHPVGLLDAVPAIPRARTPARLISELNDTASVSAVYASSGALLHPHARLASGRWLAFAGRASNPLDSNEKFQSATSDLLLSQAYPGATECKSSETPMSTKCAINVNSPPLLLTDTNMTRGESSPMPSQGTISFRSEGWDRHAK
jgi:hypothetical protein